MGISKQIGWSPKANLYYQISQQLERLIGVTSKIVLVPPVPVIPNVTLMIDNSPNFDIPEYLGAGVNPSDYTIEWWSNLDVNNSNSVVWSIGSNLTHAVSIADGIINYWINGNIVASGTLSQGYIGQWSYFTVGRYKDLISIFQNGIRLVQISYIDAIPTNGLPLYLGSRGNGSAFKGRMTNFRWSNDWLYTTDTTDITPPTSPLTVLSSTKLLIFKGTSLVNQITDQSGSGYTITNVSGVYDPSNPFAGVQGSIDFSYVIGFTFKVNNASGTAGDGSNGAQYTTTSSSFFDAYVNWGDGSNLQYYTGSPVLELNHTFTSNSIFDVTVYLKDPTIITIFDSTPDKGNFYMLEVDYSRLINANSFYLTSNELPSTQVNKLLNQAVVNGINGGVLQIANQTPPASPTGQGLIDKDTLLLRGWTVTTD